VHAIAHQPDGGVVFKSQSLIPLRNVTLAGSGNSFTCALSTNGGVKCWGHNNYGQLGDGSTTNSLTPVDIADIDNQMVSVSVGSYHACSLTAVGNVRCWG